MINQLASKRLSVRVSVCFREIVFTFNPLTECSLEGSSSIYLFRYLPVKSGNTAGFGVGLEIWSLFHSFVKGKTY